MRAPSSSHKVSRGSPTYPLPGKLRIQVPAGTRQPPSPRHSRTQNKNKTRKRPHRHGRSRAPNSAEGGGWPATPPLTPPAPGSRPPGPSASGPVTARPRSPLLPDTGGGDSSSPLASGVPRPPPAPDPQKCVLHTFASTRRKTLPSKFAERSPRPLPDPHFRGQGWAESTLHLGCSELGTCQPF